MIHPRFFDLVDQATALGLKLTISTNGTLITPEKAALLKAANVAYVGISLDGIGPIHDQFRRKEGAFDAAVRGFKNCHAVDQKTGLRLTLTRHNVENINQILDFIEDQEIQRVCFYHLVPAGRGSELQVLAPEEARGAIDTLIARVEAWHRQGIDRELLTVTQPADGAYLLVRMQQRKPPEPRRSPPPARVERRRRQQLRPRHRQHRHPGQRPPRPILAGRDPRQRQANAVLTNLGRPQPGLRRNARLDPLDRPAFAGSNARPA